MGIKTEIGKDFTTKFTGNPYKIQVMVLLQLIFLFIFTSNYLPLIKTASPKIRDSAVNNMLESTAPLLLNSGLTQVKTAQVKYILWFEDTIPKSVIQALPQEGWNWEQKEMLSDSGKAVTLVVSKSINQTEETDVEVSFLELMKIVNKAGGHAFFDERVNQALDIAAFLSTFKAMPKQWNYIQNTKSITAYQQNFGTGIQAGNDIVNIQMLTRSSNDRGKTVLAIPVLLEEF